MSVVDRIRGQAAVRGWAESDGEVRALGELLAAVHALWRAPTVVAISIHERGIGARGGQLRPKNRRAPSSVALPHARGRSLQTHDPEVMRSGRRFGTDETPKKWCSPKFDPSGLQAANGSKPGGLHAQTNFSGRFLERRCGVA